MIEICTNNSIRIDGRSIGLSMAQRREGTVIYTPECAASGQKYQEHTMPNARYSAAHDAPASGAAGRLQLEKDLRDLLNRLGA